ncbi:hypothetical protein Gotri_012750 [Gossypium trilobum]|uniref:Uncharacterized protein n=1 Tax=Gossypium trilobum TaxID=34281 RepID=A0A7J9DSD0_9ROSI|nr:hypothetical protein [Gossypium trilobum]
METSPQKQAKVKVPKSKTLKGKRARLYIIRRCIFMLLCWKDQGDKNLGVVGGEVNAGEALERGEKGGDHSGADPGCHLSQLLTRDQAGGIVALAVIHSYSTSCSEIDWITGI